ncbi:MAG TPA: glycosyltransferase family 4 protein [Terriglobales bacterium]
MTAITVCMFDNETVRGGAEEHMLCLLRRLDRTRFRLLLACPEELIERLQPDLPSDVIVQPVAPHSPRQIGAVRGLYRFLKSQSVQILHSHGFRSSLIASPVACAARVPVTIETPHVREYWRKGWKSSYAIDRQSSRFVDRYIAVSEANRKYLVEQKRLPATKVTVIRNGCDVSHFDPEHRAPKGLRQSAGFGTKDPVLMIAGRLEHQKGHVVLLRALARLKPEFPLLRLVALGEGSLRGELQAQLRQFGLEDSVYMPGHCGDIRDWMAAADVCVLPSFAEGLPLFAMECLAAGRPMVASAVDGTPEIVVNGKTGLTFPPGDADALASALSRLLRDRTLAAELGSGGALWVREWFTLARQVRETEELYESLWCENTGQSLAAHQLEQRGELVHRR